MRRPAAMRPLIALGGRRRVVAIVDVLGRGPEQHVAVDGRRHQHTLRPLGGHRQQDRRQQRAGQLVEDDQLAPARRDGELVVTEAPVDEVGAETGGIDHPGGPDVASPWCGAPSRRVTLGVRHLDAEL